MRAGTPALRGDVEVGVFRVFGILGVVILGLLLVLFLLVLVGDGVEGIFEFLDVFGVVLGFLGLDFFGAQGFVGLAVDGGEGVGDGVVGDE
jgi:hypothetical protein